MMPTGLISNVELKRLDVVPENVTSRSRERQCRRQTALRSCDISRIVTWASVEGSRVDIRSAHGRRRE